MKILYAVQATGNGHISRAAEIIPLLQTYGSVDVMLSGNNAHIARFHFRNQLSVYSLELRLLGQNHRHDLTQNLIRILLQMHLSFARRYFGHSVQRSHPYTEKLVQII